MKKITADTLFELKFAGTPQFSQDGKYLAYTVKGVKKDLKGYESDLYVVKEDGQNIRLTAGGDGNGFVWTRENTLLFSALSCQMISNVPSAILLSQFTSNYPALLVGVNIGGTGTLIASLASLITFREYTSHNPGKTGSYVRLFSLFNFGFLFLLTGVMLLVGV
jgi:dipeptidyl aminopeptidase/acylaminoacyl peptidase